MIHHLPAIVYYEDTDFTGVVYHANYLKYFERAREHLLGIEEQRRLWSEDGVGFAVYRLSMRFRAPAVHGDTLDIRTTVRAETDYRLVFQHAAWRGDEARALVEAEVELVAIDRQGRLVILPPGVRARLAAG